MKNLRPAATLSVSENPSGHVLGLNHEDTRRDDRYVVNLCRTGPGRQRDIRQQHTGFGIKPSLKGFGHARFTDTTLEAWRGDHKLQRHHRDGKREDWPYLTGNGENGELVDHERPFARCAHVGLAHRRELRPRLWQHHVRPLADTGAHVIALPV
jgi:hypothetical protein